MTPFESIASSPHTSRMLELISFEICGQEYCIDVRAVREIRGWSPATPMPQTPGYILGVINPCCQGKSQSLYLGPIQRRRVH